MADSKVSGSDVAAFADEQHSLVTHAMALRVKYRRVDAEGKPIKTKIGLSTAGIHPKNRGGLYPSGRRCKALAVDVVGKVGFLKECVEHSAVAVEEPPASFIKQLGADYVSGSEYNIKSCSKDPLLKNLFAVPHDDVRSLLLSHNHIMLVMRAFMVAAHWDIPINTEKNLRMCDEKGNLSLTAIAAHNNGKELVAMVADGIECEQLAWEMDVEEPTAASIISQALNSAQELALRTSELTAVAVLKGEIIVQMGPKLSQQVVYRTVIERVRRELMLAADDPDLPDVYDFLRSIGVGYNTYIDGLLDFGATFVDSKKRQLRFSAFAVANQIDDDLPLTKIGVLKRAYRKKPSHGYCPNPESDWTKIDTVKMARLEDILFFSIQSVRCRLPHWVLKLRISFWPTSMWLRLKHSMLRRRQA